MSLAAAGLYSKMLSYSADKMTDGRVPEFLLPALTGGEDPGPVVSELETAGMVYRDGNAWQIHSYKKHNMTRAEWEAERTRQRNKKRKQRSESRDCPPGTGEGTTPGSPGGVSTSSSSSEILSLPSDPDLYQPGGSQDCTGEHEVALRWQDVVRVWADWYTRITGGLQVDLHMCREGAESIVRRLGSPARTVGLAAVQDAVEALARSKWWESKGARIPGWDHFVKRFDSYLLDARGAPGERKRQKHERELGRLADERREATERRDWGRVESIDAEISQLEGRSDNAGGDVVPLDIRRGLGIG